MHGRTRIWIQEIWHKNTRLAFKILLEGINKYLINVTCLRLFLWLLLFFCFVVWDRILCMPGCSQAYYPAVDGLRFLPLSPKGCYYLPMPPLSFFYSWLFSRQGFLFSWGRSNNVHNDLLKNWQHSQSSCSRCLPLFHSPLPETHPQPFYLFKEAQEAEKNISPAFVNL